MKNLDWFWKGIFFWLCVVYHLNNVGVDGHHNDTCLSSDGQQAICVANRYCRERFKHHLLSCGDNKVCCPIPTTQTSSSKESARRPSSSEKPKIYPPDDVYPARTEDGSLRKPVSSFNEPVRDSPFSRPGENDRPIHSPDIENTQDKDLRSPPRRPVEKGIPNYGVDDSPPNWEEDGRSRKPIISYDKPVDEVPARRRLESGRPRHNADGPSIGDGHSRRPINTHNKPPKDVPPRRPVSSERQPTYAPMDGRDYTRKPIDVYNEPIDKTPIRNHEEHAKPIGKPRYDDHVDRLPTKPGKVRFEDESHLGREVRPSKPLHKDLPSGTETKYTDAGYASRPENLPTPKKETTESTNNHRDDRNKHPRPDDIDKRRQNDDVPSHYPSNDQIEVHRDAPRGVLKPTRVLSQNHSIDVSKSNHEKFPEHYEFSVSQPKVPECGVKPYELFIAGGEASEPHEWPWMTAIFRRHQSSRPKTFICGGSLINTKYVLTAAHCFVHNYKILPASTFVVRVGSHQLNSGEEYTVSDLVVHHNHSGSDFFNDIALLKLASEVYVTDKIAPICLPFQNMAEENFVGKMGTVAGWGDTSFRTGAARTLQHVTIPIVSSDECFAAYSRVRGAAFLARGSDHVICAGLREGGKDACLGDSGGPLMLKATEDRWIVVGIVSLGYKCAEPGYPGVYTRVTHYLSWIQNNMKRH